MSFLSFFGSSFTGAHLLSQIYRRPEFTSFLKNLTEKTTSFETVHQFVRNLLLTYLDPIVVPLLNTTENKNIFKNKRLTRLEQSKVFYGKLLNHLLNHADIDNFNKHDYTNLFSVIISSFGLGVMEGLKEQKNVFIEQGISTLNQIPEMENAESPTDVYRIVIDKYSKIISGILYLLIDFTHSPVSESTLLNISCDIMDSFNTVYEYQSPIHKNDGNNNDDSSSSSDADPVPNKLKRARAMEGLPKKDKPKEDKRDEPKKPKN